MHPDAFSSWQVALVAASVVLACLMIFAVRARLLAWHRHHVAQLRARHALAGEARAEGLLVAAGYRIEARQRTTRYTVRVDGEPHRVELRADYLVEAGGRRMIAEVKTGPKAPLVRTRATRRQLLEYAVAFGVDGVLLVDADAGTVQEVEFPGIGGKRRETGGRIGWLAVAIAAAALTWWLLGGDSLLV